MRAARYLGVPPWELARMPVYWRDRALLFESVENQARSYLEERAAGGG